MSKNSPEPKIIVTDYFETQGSLKDFYSHAAAIKWAIAYEASTGNRVRVKNKITGKVYPHKDIIPSNPNQMLSVSLKKPSNAQERAAYLNRRRIAKSQALLEDKIKQGTYKIKGRPVNVRLERIVTIADNKQTIMQGRKGKQKGFEHRQVEGFAKASRYFLDVQAYVNKRDKKDANNSK